MQIFLFTAGAESDELSGLERRIRARLPGLEKITRLDEVVRGAGERANAPDGDLIYIIFPVLTSPTSLERLLGMVEQNHAGLFFIFVSREISASDYKRLVRNGGADWASLHGAPQEIEEIVASKRDAPGPTAISDLPALRKPAIVAFVPSSGGVGNSTLAVESAIGLKLGKTTKHFRLCLLDLDLQTSHVCDYLDIEPRLQMQEIVENPDRLDAQLFDLFLAHHSSGLDVLASPRDRARQLQPSIGALEKLFGMIASRYDILILDLPPTWYEWTPQVVSVCDAAVVTGFNTVPGLRQVSETLAAVRNVTPAPSQVVVGLNRCVSRLFGRVANWSHVKRVLGRTTVHAVRLDSTAAIQSSNTGIPIGVGGGSKIAKDIQPFAALLASLAPAPDRRASRKSRS